MKYFVIITMLCALFCSGCGEEPSKNTSGKKELVVWVTYGEEEYAEFEKICREFEQKNPGVLVKSSKIPWGGHESKFETAMGVGQAPPDIGRVDASFVVKLAKLGAVVDLNQFGVMQHKDEYVPAAFNSNVMDGKVYGLPDQTTGVCLFYNKDMFKEAGIDENTPPKTWDEFMEYAKKLTTPEHYGFGMSNSLWWNFPFFNSFGAKFLSDDRKKCLLNSPEARASLQFQVSLFENKVEGGAWKSGGISPEVGFLNKKYAMIFMGPWNVKRFQDAGLNFGVALIPAGPAGTSTNVGGTNMVVFDSCENKKEAYEFLRFLTSVDVQARWCSVLKQIPVNVNAYDKVDADPIQKTFMEQMKYAKARPQVLEYGKLEEIINPEMEAALSGIKTVDKALSDAVNRIENDILAKE